MQSRSVLVKCLSKWEKSQDSIPPSDTNRIHVLKTQTTSHAYKDWIQVSSKNSCVLWKALEDGASMCLYDATHGSYRDTVREVLFAPWYCIGWLIRYGLVLGQALLSLAVVWVMGNVNKNRSRFNFFQVNCDVIKRRHSGFNFRNYRCQWLGFNRIYSALGPQYHTTEICASVGLNNY